MTVLPKHPADKPTPREPTPNETTIYTAYLSDLGRIGERHQTLRQFYVSVVTVLMTFVGLSKANDALFNTAREVRMVAGTVGMALCALWAVQMGTFASIYSAKIAVLKKMEECWTIRPFEWERKHRPRLTTIDMVVAVVVIIVFAALLWVF